MPFWRVLIMLTALLCLGEALATVLRTPPAPARPAALPRSAAMLSPPTLPTDTRILRYPRLLPVSLSTDATPLLVSNSPETPKTPGLLYRDVVRNTARVMAYHSNGLEQPARVLIVAEWPGDSVASAGHLTLLRRGSAVTGGPDPLIGQQTLLRYFASGPESASSPGPAPLTSVGQPRTVLAGTRLTLYDSGLLKPGQVVSALLDLYTDTEVTVSVYLLRAGDPPGTEGSALAPDGVHQRGTFLGANRDWTVSVPRFSDDDVSPVRLLFSDAADPPLAGTDALTGRPQLLRGNFGVLYSVSLMGAAGVLMAASARGGPYRGSLFMRDTSSQGQVRRTPLLIGRGRALLDAALPAAIWQIGSDAAHFEFMPANGSNLPLALVFYPDGVHRTIR